MKIGKMRIIGATAVSFLIAGSIIAQPTSRVELKHLSTYHTGVFEQGAAEISSYDPSSKRLFFINAPDNRVDVLDLSDPLQPELLFGIDMNPYGGGCNSVVVFDGWVAVAEQANTKTQPGKVVFFNIDGDFIQQVDVGALPDMLTITPDHQRILVANEGEPSDSYSEDPEGSVTIIDLSAGIGQLTPADVTELDFTLYNYIRNSFEIGSWNYSVFPPAYNAAGETWAAVTSLGGKQPILGTHFWGISDVVNGNSGGNFFHTLTFDPVDIAGRPRASLSFKYFASGFELADSIGYIVAYDNGVEWNMEDAVWLEPTALWKEVTVEIPQPYETLRIQLLAKQDGPDDFAGFEDVRVSFLDESTRIFGNNGLSTAAQDLEPEYIAVAPDNSRAWVVFQENNAMGMINLQTLQLENIKGLGFKDYLLPQNQLDASDQGGVIAIQNWPVKGIYQPDAFVAFSVEGEHYILSANEGDTREYPGYNEEVRISSRTLDPVAFPNGSILKQNTNLGRLRTTISLGDTDWDGDYDELYCFGGRSFSIWNADGSMAFDSGDQFEQITAQAYPNGFNSNHNNNSSFKTRSDDKGPEPEAATIGEIYGRKYAFVGLERIGGIMMYDVTNPVAPEFVQYLNTRNFSQAANSPDAGDLGPEGIIFIPKSQSPNLRDLIVTASEVSGTVSVFQLDINLTITGETPLEVSAEPTLDVIGTSGGVTVHEGGISGIFPVAGEARTFYAVTDRGPNADASLSPLANGSAAVHFPFPEYSPRIVVINAEQSPWEIESVTPLKRPDGSLTTGLPLPAGAGSTGEIAWSSLNGDVLDPDAWGIDSEGIVRGNDGNFWICEEYGTSIWKVDPATGQVVKRYTPFPDLTNDAALDPLLGLRRANRGFEGVAWTPNGRVYAMLQSPALNPDASVIDSRIHRLVELDPLTGAMRTFFYAHQSGIGEIRERDWKIGDLVAINNNEFLLIEHAERNGWNYKHIVRISLEGATALSLDDPLSAGAEAWMTPQTALAAGVIPVQSEILLDLLENGWNPMHDKPEGLAIVDANTIAIVNDNDYGIESPLLNGEIESTGKQTQFYFYTLPQSLDWQPVSCSAELEVPAPLCTGSTTSLQASSGAVLYEWSDGFLGNPRVIDQGGEYVVRITNEDGCASYASAEVAELDSPVVEWPAQIVFCPGEEVNLSTPYEEAQHEWSDGQTGFSITTQNPGPVSVVVILPNGCSGSAATLLVEDVPAPSPLESSYSICEGDVLQLEAGDYQEIVWSNGVEGAIIEVADAGVYTFSGFTDFNCTVQGETQVVLQPLPVSGLESSYGLCEGELLVLDPGDFSGYLWSTGFEGPELTVDAGGIYSVVLTNEFDCTAEIFTTVNVWDAPILDLGEDVVAIIGEPVTLDAGAGWSNITWSTGETSQTIIVVTDGVYSAEVTDDNGCTGSDEVNVQFVTGVADFDGNSVLVYPNPMDEYLYVRIPSEWLGSDFGLSDASGRWVLHGRFAQPLTMLNVDLLSQGIYNLRVWNDIRSFNQLIVHN